LGGRLSKGDILIDLGWNTGTAEIIDWCRTEGVLFLNTSVEEWNPYSDAERGDPRKYTLYRRQMQLGEMVRRWGDNSGATAIVDHGANPGLVSHFTKRALQEISSRIVSLGITSTRRAELERALGDKDFKSMARLTGTKVIHVSERDSQIATKPKMVNEFVNTWSVEGLYEEGIAPAEMGWGTHERALPAGGLEFSEGPRNAICLSAMGVNSWVRSWVPSGPIVGMVIRHGEAFGISDRLTVWEGNQAVYRPTVHYVYCPSDATIASLHELRMNQYKLQARQRIMNNEIAEGVDELGVLLMGHGLNAWWTGTVLDIHTARQLVSGQNATTVQVAISVVAALAWMVRNPNRGFCLPDDIDADEILEFASPYLGSVVSEQVGWHPIRDLDTSLTGLSGTRLPDMADAWQYSTFCCGI
jgi:homospermidine synthase